MTDREPRPEREPEAAETETSGIRMPGFLNDEDVGLGDVIKEVTGAIGIRPCGECERRAARLNRLLIFSARRLRT